MTQKHPKIQLEIHIALSAAMNPTRVEAEGREIYTNRGNMTPKTTKQLLGDGINKLGGEEGEREGGVQYG